MVFILAGLFTEGRTDVRFLESIVKRTLDELAFDCKGQIETELKTIEIDKTGRGFVEQVLEASRKGKEEYGITLICLHTDADEATHQRAFETKIIPARNALNEKNEQAYCKIAVPIVPVQMTEAWMLADKELLKSEIGTNKSNSDLGIHREPETIADPKDTIKNAIRIAKENLTKQKRGKGLDISDLYQIIGQKLALSKLDRISSYQEFKNNLRDAFKQLNLLH
ncbi:hypothetical protein THII_1763 [Thioploca ingrica]|uniref:DUF4276 family protein n=1 Tax=Thioploca ingrica TaxID=40754 RepID=A0A090ALP2_9GAMM|nr:hypothetical protein THII_1763 [Thioploca ingrica]